MKLIWKILIVFGIVVALMFLLIVGIAIKGVISESSYYEKATWRGNVMFASPIFNEDLKNCTLTYANNWEIKGLENNQCVLWYVHDSTMDYDSGILRYIKSFCELPEEIYSNADNLNWNLLIEQGYCFLDYNYNQSTSNEEKSNVLSTFWELGDIPYSYDYLMFESCNNFKLKEKIISKGCVITDLNTRYRWKQSGDFNPPETHKEGVCDEICIDKNWLARLPSDEPIKVLVYYDFNDYGGNPKVLETEIIR